MSFIELSHFYKNFAELFDAGIDATSAMETIKRNEKRSSAIHSIQLVCHNLKSGRSLYQSLKATGYVPIFDLPLVKAAEESGRIVDIFKTLSQKHLDTHHAISKTKMGLMKPYFTFVVAVMFPGVTKLFSEEITLAAYLRNSLGVLGLVTFIFYYFYNYWIQSYFDIQKARNWNNALSKLPFFSGLVARIALEKFSSTLAMMLESGIDFFEALKQSANGSANRRIQNAVERVIPSLQTGMDLHTSIQNESVFPSELKSALSMGSQSGKLPEFLYRYSKGLKTQNENTIQLLVRYFPIVLYWLVFIQVIFAIISFYRVYLDEILKIVP